MYVAVKEGHITRLSAQYVIKNSPNRARVIVYMKDPGTQLALDQYELL